MRAEVATSAIPSRSRTRPHLVGHPVRLPQQRRGLTPVMLGQQRLGQPQPALGGEGQKPETCGVGQRNRLAPPVDLVGLAQAAGTLRREQRLDGTLSRVAVPAGERGDEAARPGPHHGVERGATSRRRQRPRRRGPPTAAGCRRTSARCRSAPRSSAPAREHLGGSAGGQEVLRLHTGSVQAGDLLEAGGQLAQPLECAVAASSRSPLRIAINAAVSRALMPVMPPGRDDSTSRRISRASARRPSGTIAAAA